MDEKALLEKARLLFEQEPKLIRLPAEGRVVFVGDTHGDLDASEEVIRRYLGRGDRIVFLGDYVDRGDYSRENVRFLLQQKIDHPEQIFLLAGNHEGHLIKPLSPTDFWDSLSWEEREVYGHLFSKLPLAASSPNGLLALHGGLPDLGSLEEIDEVRWGDSDWDRIVWGDFVRHQRDEVSDWAGRPQLSERYFRRIMDRFERKVLIRSHQPLAPLLMYEKRCITIMTSYAYVPVRRVVVADLEKTIQNCDDLEIAYV